MTPVTHYCCENVKLVFRFVIVKAFYPLLLGVSPIIPC
nr:MAG TPA: hypothetical protein [Caudoviricetes sp.]